MKISGFLTQARHRFKTQDSYTQWSDTQHLLGKIHDHQEEPASLASSSSDLNLSMRERVDSSMRLCEGADIQIPPNLGRFREKLSQLYAEVNAELSDSNAPQYYGLSEMMTSLQADANPSVETLVAKAMTLPNLLSVSSRLYQQEDRSKSIQTKFLTILTRLTETTKNMLRSRGR